MSGVPPGAPARRRAGRSEEAELRFLEGLARRLPGEDRVLQALGDLYTRVGHFHKGLSMDRTLVTRRPADPVAWYNLACSHALLEQREQALDALERAVERGYDDPGWMQRDDDLRALRGERRFTQLLERLRDRKPPAGN